MFPLGLLGLAALAGFAGYQYSKAKNNNNNQQLAQTNSNTDTDKTVADKANIYNYYTNESENGNTLFGSQKKTKRTLFGNTQL